MIRKRGWRRSHNSHFLTIFRQLPRFVMIIILWRMASITDGSALSLPLFSVQLATFFCVLYCNDIGDQTIFFSFPSQIKAAHFIIVTCFSEIVVIKKMHSFNVRLTQTENNSKKKVMKVRIIFEKGMLFSTFPKNVPETSIILSKLL